jgi:hypothetical protein
VAVVTGLALVVGRVPAPVSRQQVRRSVKGCDVMVQAGTQLLLRAGIAVQETLATGDPAFDCVQPDDPPALGGAGRFALAQDGRLGLKPADQLLVRWQMPPDLCAARVLC